MDIKHLVECMVALDMGIIPIDRSLKEAFNSLSKEEARAAKRKYRKLKKKALQCHNDKMKSTNCHIPYGKVSGLMMKKFVIDFLDKEVQKRLNA